MSNCQIKSFGVPTACRRYIALSLAAIAYCTVALVPSASLADSLRYMDESGNIHFVDRLSDIPTRYRGQVSDTKPTPVSQEEYRQQLSEWKRKKAAEEREVKRQQRERDRQEKAKKRELEKADKKKQKEQARLAKSSKTTKTEKSEKIAASTGASSSSAQSEPVASSESSANRK